MASLLEKIRWFRLCRSGLVDPFATVEDVVRALVGVQAQILPAGALAIWNRTEGVTYADIEEALYRKRTIIKLWGQRWTLHLYRSVDWPLIHAAQNGKLSWWARTLQDYGIEPDEYRALIEKVAEVAARRGVVSRSDLVAEGLAHDHLLSSWGGVFKDLVQAGTLSHAKPQGGETYFAHRRFWLPDLEWNPPTREEANAELFRRYLRAYGPAPVSDIAYWRGISVKEVNGYLSTIRDLTEIDVEGKPYLMLRDDVEPFNAEPPPEDRWPQRLLHRFDPFLLAHKAKSWLVEPRYYDRVWTTAGHIGPTILLKGRIAGIWRYDRTGKGLVITMSPFSPLDPADEIALSRQAEQIAVFFGLPLLDFRSQVGEE